MSVEGPDEVAFGAAANGAGPVGAGGRLVGAGARVGLGGGEAGGKRRGFLFQGGEGSGGQARAAGGKFGTEVLEIALQAFEKGGFGRRREGDAEKSDGRGEFIEGSEGVEDGVGLGQAEAAGQGREPVIIHGGKMAETG